MNVLGRTILSMMDDALYIYKVAGGRVGFVDSISWGDDQFPYRLQRYLDNECGGAPVFVVNDMVEQYYRKERVFTAGVGSLDKRSMVDRKLEMVFPSYSVRTFLPLKEKVQRDGSKMTSDVYLFAAIASSSKLTQVAQGIRESNATPLGLGLLPLESVGLVETLVKKVSSAKGGDTTKWSLVLGQHRNGFMRQIVVRNGDIALTRMTQILDDEDAASDAEWARDVSEQFAATMNYLRRLGYNPNDGLDVILIAPAHRADMVRSQLEGQHSFYSFTPSQALGFIKMSLDDADFDDGHYSDVLNVAWLSKKFMPSVALPFADLTEVMAARIGASLAAIGLGLLLVFSTLQLGGAGVSVMQGAGDLSAQKDVHGQLTRQYQAEVDRMAALGIDLPLIQASSKVDKRLAKGRRDPLVMVSGVQKALGGQGVYLNKFAYYVDGKILDVSDKKTDPRARRGRYNPARQQAVAARDVQLYLWVQFADDVQVDLGNKKLRDIKQRLLAEFDGYSVDITKFLGDTKYVSGLMDEQGSALSNQDGIAEIVIKGAGR